jgi:hypothetical protein
MLSISPKISGNGTTLFNFYNQLWKQNKVVPKMALY